MNNESSSFVIWTITFSLCGLIGGAFFMFGESIWAPMSVKIREESISQSSTYTQARVKELRRLQMSICSPTTPVENIPGLSELFVETADELEAHNVPADLQPKVDLARQGKSFCDN